MTLYHARTRRHAELQTLRLKISFTERKPEVFSGTKRILNILRFAQIRACTRYQAVPEHLDTQKYAKHIIRPPERLYCRPRSPSRISTVRNRGRIRPTRQKGPVIQIINVKNCSLYKC